MLDNSNICIKTFQLVKYVFVSLMAQFLVAIVVHYFIFLSTTCTTVEGKKHNEIKNHGFCLYTQEACAGLKMNILQENSLL